jgi:uncharacterized protein
VSLPFDLTTGAAIWMGIAALVAGFVRGYSGFGYSAMIVAAGSLVSDPLHFVAVVVILETVMSAQAWRRAGPAVDWKRVEWLMVGAAMGLPLGLWALTAIPENAARAVIAVYVLLMCAVLLAGVRLGSEVLSARGNGLAGFASGLANAPGMGGLPVAAFFAAQPMPPAIFRATLIAYFPLLDVFSMPLYGFAGLVVWDTLWLSLGLMVPTLIGNAVGGQHFFGTDPQEFRRFAIVLLAGLAALALIKAVV